MLHWFLHVVYTKLVLYNYVTVAINEKVKACSLQLFKLQAITLTKDVNVVLSSIPASNTHKHHDGKNVCFQTTQQETFKKWVLYYNTNL